MDALLVYGLVILAFVLIQVMIVRWIFRIDTQIQLLIEIRDLLKGDVK
jgi:hypothetical protein